MFELSLAGVRSVLCLGAHADDIEIGAGGTLRAIVEACPGVKVHWVVFSATEPRMAEAKASAAEFLAGASADVQVEAFTDGFFPSEAAAIKRVFEDLKRRMTPDVVLTHHLEDRHQDHRTVADLTWNTFRDHLVLEYEVIKYDGDLGRPGVFVPIADAQRRFKIDTILRRYLSQRDKHWFTRETFEAIMRVRGVESRSPTGYAEAFHARKVVLSPAR